MTNFFSIRVLTAGAACALAACAPSANETEQTISARPAKLLTVTEARTTRRQNYPAIVRAARSTQLAFEVGGRLTELDIVEGTEVDQGQILAQVEQRDYRNQLARAQSEYDNAEAEYQRARQLVQKDAISRSVLDGRKTTRDIARAALDTAEKALTDTTLRAPYSGFIGNVAVKQFQNVQPLEPIATLQSEGVEVVVNIPATVIAYVPQLTEVSTTVILDAAPDIEIPAVFKEASGEADPNTQTYEVSFAFTPPDNLLILPGMTATLQSQLQLNENFTRFETGLAAPVSAILAEGEDRFVWVVNEQDMTVSKRTVEIGASIDDTVAILGGLEAGETIVAAGGSFVHEGMKVSAWKD